MRGERMWGAGSGKQISAARPAAERRRSSWRLPRVPRRQLPSWWLMAALLALLPGLLAGCLWFPATGPDWTQRRLILVPGVCMDATNLPPPPPLPPGLPPLPRKVDLPTFLSCGPDDQPLDARSRAMATFGTLVTAVEHPARGQQGFRSGDLRYYSFDSTSPAAYTPSDTRQPLEISAAAFEREFQAWHRQEPRATFDIVAHSLGGNVALYWAVRYATPDELRYVHAIATLDSPVVGYPAPLFDLLKPYLTPLFGDVASELSSDSAVLQRLAQAPAKWQSGPGKYFNAVFELGNVRDLVVPAFIATLSGSDGTIDDFGLGPDTLNHGAVLRAAKGVSTIAAVLQTTTGPQLA
jgi:hypothetical protein